MPWILAPCGLHRLRRRVRSCPVCEVVQEAVVEEIRRTKYAILLVRYAAERQALAESKRAV